MQSRDRCWKLAHFVLRRPFMRILLSLVALCLGGLTVMLVGVATGDPSGSEVLELHLDTVTAAGMGTVTSGSTPDSSGNNLTAQAQGSSGTGRFASGLDLSDAGDGVTVADNPLLEPAHVTVMAWVKHLGTPGDLETLVGKGEGDNQCHSQSYALSTGYQGGIFFLGTFTEPDGSGDQQVSPEGSASAVWDGNWHAIAGTFDGSNLDFYEDGQLIGSTPIDPSWTLRYGSGDSDLYVGGLPTYSIAGGATCDGSSTRFSGDVDEVRVYNRALTAQEIATLQDPSATTPPELPASSTGTTTTGTGSTTTATTTTATTGTGTTTTPPLSGQWYEIGSSESTVNHLVTGDAMEPILAAADGTPDLAWTESDPVGDSLVTQARVASLGSSSVEARPWNELLSPNPDYQPPTTTTTTTGTGTTTTTQQSPTAFSLNLDPSHNATHTRVAVAGGVRYAAWIEPDANGKGQVHVQSWDGTAWSNVGGASSLNMSAADDARNVSIADVKVDGTLGNLFVAWTETVNGVSELFGKLWNGTSWSQLTGSAISSAGAQVTDFQADDATNGPTVVWVEDPQGSSIGTVQFASYAANPGGQGPQWVKDAGPISDAGDNASSPSATNITGHIVVAFSEHVPSAQQNQASDVVLVKEDSASGWTTVGGSAINSIGQALQPVLTSTSEADDPHLWLAYTFRPVESEPYQLHTDSYDWDSAGPWTSWGVLNHNVQTDASDPSIVDAAGQTASTTTATGPPEVPVVAWTETDSNGHEQVHSAAFGTPPTNTALPSLSGTPQNGDQLTCDNGSWTAADAVNGQPTHFTDVWERGARNATSNTDPSWTPIAGATASTYTVQSADDGFRVRCRVVASDGVVAAQAYTASLRTDAGPPSLNDISYPRIEGTPEAGHTLTCDVGPLVDDPSAPGWHNNPDFTYFWLRNGQPIEDATSATYTPLAYYYDGDTGFTLPGGDGDHTLTCGVHAVNDLGSTTGDSVGVFIYDGQPILGPAAPAVTQSYDDPAHPTPLAETLSCSSGQFIEGTGQYAYQWLRNGSPIMGATSPTYRVTVEDYGRELSCETTDTNPFGTSEENVSDQVLIAIPTGTDDVSIHMEGGGNAIDPTSFLASTQRYKTALATYTVAMLKQGIANATATCQSEQATHHWPGLNHVPAVSVPFQSEEDKCRVLLGAPDQIIAEPDGVRWFDGNCQPDDTLAAETHATTCPDVDIQVTPINPQAPPQINGTELSNLAGSTPAEYIWDLDGDGRTDAVCPASAPVLSTIFDTDRMWHPRVTVVDEDGSVHTGIINFTLGTGTYYGSLRSSQVRVCETSFDPPPSTQPNLPCVTSGQIGTIAISNANLCPIDARQLSPADLQQLHGISLPGVPDLEAYLMAASENKLAASGQLTDRAARGRPDGGPLETSYVDWSTRTEVSARVAVRPARGPHAVDAGQAIATGSTSSTTVAAATASALASFTSENSPAKYAILKLPSGAVSTPVGGGKFNVRFANFPRFTFDPSKAPLAYDQIYLARGPGSDPGSPDPSGVAGLDQAADAADSVVPGVTGQTGQALLNGVGLSAAPNDGEATGLLLVGSDVGGALPGVKSFTVTGQHVAATMGLPVPAAGVPCNSGTSCKAVALGEAQAYTAQLKDDLTAQGKAAATQALQAAASNLEQMTTDYQKDASAAGQALWQRVKDSLDIGPFNLSGDPSLKLNDDGTATLTVSVSLPGLTGTGIQRDAQTGKPVLDSNGNPIQKNGAAISGTATFFADQNGHIALRGVHIEADDAFFFGIELTNVSLDWNSNTGFDVKGKIVIGALGNTTIDIRNFQLDPNGKFQDLSVDYMAGAGYGIPIFPAIDLNELGFDINTAQSNFSATVGVAIGATTGTGCVPLGATGTVDIDLAKPVSVSGTVSPQVFCLPFGDLTFKTTGTGNISLDGNWGLHTPIVNFDIGLGADFGPRLDADGNPISPYYFQVYAHGDGSIVGIIDGSLDAVISSKGLAACGSINLTIPIVGDVWSLFTGSRTIHISAGAAEDFADGVPLSPSQILSNLHVFTGCDIARYYPLGTPKGFEGNLRSPLGAASPQGTFRLPAHRGPEIVEFTGAGHAPRFTLVSPTGATYNVTTTGRYGSRLAHGAWGSIVDADSKTAVILPNPTGGVWTIRPASGSAPVIEVSHAAILPPPAIRAHLSGAGATRVLHYAAVAEPGQTMRIVEQSHGLSHQIGIIGASKRERVVRGRFRYTLGEAQAETRDIVAIVSQNGLADKELLLATYRAPNPKVGAVTKLKVRHSANRALITWRPGALDRTYFVHITYGDGRKTLSSTTHPRLLTQGITRTEGMQVTVYGESLAGRDGPVAATSLSGSMRVGSVTQMKPYKTPVSKPKPISKGRGTKPKTKTKTKTKKHR